MAKKLAPRKAKKRSPVKQSVVDDDLNTLAEVLDEYRLSNSVENWFSIPWRDGWRAIELAFVLGQGCGLTEVERFLRETIRRRSSQTEVYYESAELIQHCSTSFRSPSRYMYAALRCLQVLCSNSSGGGEVYNIILRRAIDTHDEHEAGMTLDQVEAVVTKYRCFDALGLDDSSIKSSLFAKSIKAFEIAWKRGLYNAAYAIRPAKHITMLTTMWTVAGTEASFNK